jgi:hypothetical protein
MLDPLLEKIRLTHPELEGHSSKDRFTYHIEELQHKRVSLIFYKNNIGMAYI